MRGGLKIMACWAPMIIACLVHPSFQFHASFCRLWLWLKMPVEKTAAWCVCLVLWLGSGETDLFSNMISHCTPVSERHYCVMMTNQKGQASLKADIASYGMPTVVMWNRGPRAVIAKLTWKPEDGVFRENLTIKYWSLKIHNGRLLMWSRP